VIRSDINLYGPGKGIHETCQQSVILIIDVGNLQEKRNLSTPTFGSSEDDNRDWEQKMELAASWVLSGGLEWSHSAGKWLGLDDDVYCAATARLCVFTKHEKLVGRPQGGVDVL